MNRLNSPIFGVVGGDLRQGALAKSLLDTGQTVRLFCITHPPAFLPLTCCPLHLLSECDVVILPLPLCSADGNFNAPLCEETVPLSDIFSRCKEQAILFGGKVGQAQQELAQQFGLQIHDYLAREEMAVLNAVPTAEGAVALAMHERASTLWESRCLVTGFGRCGKQLAALLRGFGAQVSVCARKEGDLALARALGMHPVPLKKLNDALPQQEIIFNTIPSPVLLEEQLQLLEPDCLIIDLASRPGGVDWDAARKLNCKAIWALSLPGKVAPLTAGSIIRDTVLHMLEELSPTSK